MDDARSEAPDAQAHYARLAGNYNALWDHTPAFRQWMVSQIIDIVNPPRDATVADVGGGTGLFAAELLRQLGPSSSVYLLDPSAGMLAQAPPHPRLLGLHASAAQTRSRLAEEGVHDVDVVLVKEAVHHFPDPPSELADLATLLGPGQALLVVMLPKRIQYPLFASALTRFTDLQPDPANIAEYLSSAGLTTTRQVRSYPLTIETPHWLEMVSNRFMSLLSTFDDVELANGVAEIERRIGAHASVSFDDDFEFVLGRR